MGDQSYTSHSTTVLQISKIANRPKFRTKWQLRQLHPLWPSAKELQYLTGYLTLAVSATAPSVLQLPKNVNLPTGHRQHNIHSYLEDWLGKYVRALSDGTGTTHQFAASSDIDVFHYLNFLQGPTVNNVIFSPICIYTVTRGERTGRKTYL